MKGVFDRISGIFRNSGKRMPPPPATAGDSAPYLTIRSAIEHHQAGRLREAEQIYSRVLDADPKNFDALHLKGVAAHQMGEHVRAAELIGKALAIEPANCSALSNIAVVYQALNRLDEGEKSLLKALALQPNYDLAHNNLGMNFRARGDLDRAEASFRSAVDLNPNNAEALANLGGICKDKGNLDQAETHYRRALELNPNAAEACNNLGAVLQQRGDLDGAAELYRRALALRPDYSGARSNLGSALLMHRNLTEAEACIRAALQSNPNEPSAQYNLAMLLLLRGDYREGLPLYESRFDALPQQFAGASAFAARLKPWTRWQGESLSKRRLLVWTEQGLGDSLMVMRFLPSLRKRGASSVVVACDPALHRLMQSLEGVSVILSRGDTVPSDAYDVHCPIMSLPYLLRIRHDAIPGEIPYLFVPGTLKSAWAERLSGVSGMKVGLVWAGSSALRDDARRSIALDQFAPLRDIAGIRLVSLQKGDAARQCVDWRGDMIDFMDECTDLMDTAALVESLHLVVSVDTAVAHLAGALGKPVWLLNRSESEWRWGLEREDTPWYPTMRIFNQQRSLEWGSVIERIAGELRARASS